MTFRLIFGVMVLFSSLTLIQCSSTSTISDKENSKKINDGYSTVDGENSARDSYALNPNEDRKSNQSLEDMLKRLPGLEVRGGGQNVKFKVRGSESLFSQTDPLFVVNGQPAGTNFIGIRNLIDPNDIKSIKVIKGPDASIYGTRGANGVIVIKTN